MTTPATCKPDCLRWGPPPQAKQEWGVEVDRGGGGGEIRRPDGARPRRRRPARELAAARWRTASTRGRQPGWRRWRAERGRAWARRRGRPEGGAGGRPGLTQLRRRAGELRAPTPGSYSRATPRLGARSGPAGLTPAPMGVRRALAPPRDRPRNSSHGGNAGRGPWARGLPGWRLQAAGALCPSRFLAAQALSLPPRCLQSAYKVARVSERLAQRSPAAAEREASSPLPRYSAAALRTNCEVAGAQPRKSWSTRERATGSSPQGRRSGLLAQEDRRRRAGELKWEQPKWKRCSGEAAESHPGDALLDFARNKPRILHTQLLSEGSQYALPQAPALDACCRGHAQLGCGLGHHTGTPHQEDPSNASVSASLGSHYLNHQHEDRTTKLINTTHTKNSFLIWNPVFPSGGV
ncbi:uncharacterized protein LOC143441406 [Arvicanthis niloticus]|uniref:uncharacterized protein LOC143311616 n=1 Tax=Arvicanthis niloticus TaxID=61156 RepID=UPI00402BEB67